MHQPIQYTGPEALGFRVVRGSVRAGEEFFFDFKFYFISHVRPVWDRERKCAENYNKWHNDFFS